MPIERLPMKVQPAAYRVRAFLMTDSTALLLLFIVQIAVGFYYLPNVLGDPLQWHRPVESIMPITIWAWVHIVVGLLCLVAAFTDRGHIDVVALAAATGLNLSWTFSLLAAAVEHDQAVLWLVGVLILAMTVSLMWAVWRGKRGDIPLAEDRGENMSVIAATLAAFGGLVTAVGSVWMGYMKARSDTQAAKGSRIDIMEARLDKLQVDLDAERSRRSDAETLAHRLRLGLITAMNHLDALIRWADGGSPPPPPTAPDLKAIKSLIED